MRSHSHAVRTTLINRLPRVALRSVLLALGSVMLLALALVNLSSYPAPWFDEGQFLHVPKALLQHGVYADWSSEGPRFYGPTTAAGPTLLLPVAAMYAMFGTGLLQARLVVTIYLLVSLALCYVIAARLNGKRTALLAVALLISVRGAAGAGWGTLWLGRQVLGEIPALAFVLAGVWFWHNAVGQRSSRQAALAGVCWGLAMITKNQVLVALTPALALLALLDWWVYRTKGWLVRWLPLGVALGMAGTWLIILFALLGPGTFADNVALTRQAAGGAIIVLSPDAAMRALRLMVSPRVYGGLLLPALIYGAWRMWRRRDVLAQREAAVLIIIAVWLAWFVCSLAWPRYGYIAVALGALPVARLIADAVGWAQQRRMRVVTFGIATAAALLIALPLAQTTGELLRPDRSAARFAAYLDQNVPRDAIIETWEPELGALTDHRYHYPPQALLDVAVRHQWSGGPPARYDLEQIQAPYVVVGPFGAWTGVYADQLAHAYEPVRSEGPYVLYRRLP